MCHSDTCFTVHNQTLAGTWLTLWTPMRKKDLRYIIHGLFNSSTLDLYLFCGVKTCFVLFVWTDLIHYTNYDKKNVMLYSELYLILCVQGKTVEVGRAHFETEHTRFTILDAPVFSLTIISKFRC